MKTLKGFTKFHKISIRVLCKINYFLLFFDASYYLFHHTNRQKPKIFGVPRQGTKTFCNWKGRKKNIIFDDLIRRKERRRISKIYYLKTPSKFFSVPDAGSRGPLGP